MSSGLDPLYFYTKPKPRIVGDSVNVRLNSPLYIIYLHTYTYIIYIHGERERGRKRERERRRGLVYKLWMPNPTRLELERGKK